MLIITWILTIYIIGAFATLLLSAYVFVIILSDEFLNKYKGKYRESLEQTRDAIQRVSFFIPIPLIACWYRL